MYRKFLFLMASERQHHSVHIHLILCLKVHKSASSCCPSGRSEPPCTYISPSFLKAIPSGLGTVMSRYSNFRSRSNAVLMLSLLSLYPKAET
ncbi:hypothetical protein DPEC_G00293920 [Dallia pectoralis]|uniref:Uncharacterized protein n=1 Tax=Dallia pectoralis TaxID=75939 RepID=A0ACC2FIC4_DALPE|nr:hypothetical protein DPEC_G00293920 [Dallia pectoralis]